MKNDIHYKGFTACLEIDHDNGVVEGRINGIPDVVTFSTSNLLGLKDEFRKAVDDYLEDCAAVGREPNKTCSGNVQFRVAPSLHSAALVVSKQYGSFNKFGEHILKEAVMKHLPLVNIEDLQEM